MKDNIMIEVNDVSMRFNLGIEKGFSLKQGFVDLFNKEKRKNKKKNEFWALKDVDFKVNKVKLWDSLDQMELVSQHF